MASFGLVARWVEFETAEPDLAARVRARFDSGRHKTMATLRRDGSPRISGVEVEFHEGDLILGVTPGSVKGDDLRRDPRLAIHSPSPDPPETSPSDWAGDAKLSGRAVELLEPVRPEPPALWFRVELEEVALTWVGDPPDHLLVESWHPGRGRERRERR